MWFMSCQKGNTMLKIIGFLLLSVMASSASAGFVSSDYASTDWKVSGDSMSMLQKSTGLEWLKLGHTDGRNINDVISRFGEGGEFEGWRLPTPNEVNALMMSYYSDYISSDQAQVDLVAYGTNDAYWSQTRWMRDTLGGSGYQIWNAGGGKTYRALSFAYHLDDAGALVASGVRHTNSRSGGTRRYELILLNGKVNGQSNGYSDPMVSVFLVSDGGVTLSSRSDPSMNANNASAPFNDVPVTTLSGLALFGLMLIRLRR
jgi:hypothetical protein